MDLNELEQRLQEIAREHLASMSYHGADSDDCNIRSKSQLSNVIYKIREIHAKYELTPQIFTGLKLIPLDVVKNRASLGVSATQCRQRLEDGEYTEDIDNSLLEIIKAYLHEVSRQAQELCEEEGERNKAKETPDQIFARLLDDYIQDLNNQQEGFRKSLSEAKRLYQEAQMLADGAKELNVKAESHIKKSQELLNTASADNLKLKEQAENIQEQVTKADSSAKVAELKAESATKTADEIIPNMLTVLGIFVGVIVAVVACYLTILLTENSSEAISAASIPLGFMFAWMMGHILVIAVFLLLYLTSKLTDRTLACHCKYYEAIQQPKQQPEGQNPESRVKKEMPECIECKKNCSSLIRLKYRFPYLFWINIAFVVGYVILGIVHIIDLYYAKHLNYIIQLNWMTLMLFAAIVLAVIVIATAVITKKISKASPKQ